MRRLLALLLVAGSAFAQNAVITGEGTSAHLPPVPTVSGTVTEPLVPVSHADLYCSGFLAKAPVRSDTYVMGGLHSPNQTRFHAHDFIFVNGDYAVGSRVSIVRQTKDVDRMEAFEGQTKALAKVGDVFGEMGYAVVVEKRGNANVAQIEFSCDAVVPGDFVVPFVEKPGVTYRKRSTVDRFPDHAQTLGRIIAARDFDQYVGAGQKVYFDIGSQKGLKPGDMLLVVRSYNPSEMDVTDRGELKTGVFEETRKNEPKFKAGDMEKRMPERALAEAVVISVQEHSATAMLTFSLAEVHVGDRIASETEKGDGNGAEMYAKDRSMKMPKLGSLCMFAVLNCPKTRPTPTAEPEAPTDAKGGNAGAPAAAGR